MNLKIIPTESFKREAKRLKKKYPRIAESLKELKKDLKSGE
jgi:mRNA-degrading endonuclease RelE of RelBE toxin-antitoxin system